MTTFRVILTVAYTFEWKFQGQQAWFKLMPDTSLFPVNVTSIVQRPVFSVDECAMICQDTPGCQRFYFKEDMAPSDPRCIMALV